ncbi:MAG: prephenate dehydrogenase/arogenate dehydrogenase family protein [Actinobacteria bacterium]|uniref:Prephenate dehydrogenase n=1 Tax=freshwater metagenome TaxID=449393 RepID=A0A6J5ZNJ1_9ZZZZ|nr:prephenate dehydrogenase/arogenate dehydrogenase family protein [Actinomycetota bacterium]
MKLTVVGVGLIGGSFALAARSRVGAHVRGVGPEAGQALELNVIDEACPSLEAALLGAEVVVVAVPADRIAEVTARVLASAPPDCAVTDVGSTKRQVVDAAGGDERFVGGHPLAGAETSGVIHARGDLFEEAVWYLTPTKSTSGVMLERVHNLVSAVGAKPTIVEVDEHDRMMAAVSQLPHVLANVLIMQADTALGDRRIPATGPSFRDATRVAGANPEMWTAIYLANQQALVDELDGAIERLTAARAAISNGDAAWLSEWQTIASERREALSEAGLSGGTLTELRVTVPNRPGVVAEIALGLRDADINIVDMALSPSPDGREGVVALWVADGSAEAAAACLAGLGLPVL